MAIPGIVALSSLDYWRVNPVQLSVFDSKVEVVKCVNNVIGSNGDIVFEIEPTPDAFIDPQIVSRLTFKITKGDSLDLDASQNVTIASNAAHSMFQDIVIKANRTRISQTNNLYPYAANLYNAYLTPKTEREMKDAMELTYLNTYGQFDSSANTNAGYTKRKNQCASSAEVDLVWIPFNELSTQDRLILPMVALQYTFTNARDVFRIMSFEPLITRNQVVKLMKMSLLVCHVQVSPDIGSAILREMRLRPIEMPVKHIVFNQVQKVQGITEFDYYIQTSGHLPECIFLFVVKSDRFSGIYNLSPFKYTPGIVQTMTIEADGNRYTTEFSKYPKDAFIAMQKAFGFYQLPITNGIDFPAFQGGYGMLSCDLTRGEQGAARFASLPRYGSVRMNIVLKAALVETMTFLIASVSREEIQVFSDFSTRASYT